MLNELTAISPIDGRYHSRTAILSEYFSEFALIRYRVKVEVEYFIALCEIPLPQLEDFDKGLYPALREIYKSFRLEDAETVKEFEKTTNHDVKSVEYFIKEKFEVLNITQYSEFVHFGLTSQDINNTSFPLMIKDASQGVIFPRIDQVINEIEGMAQEWMNIPLLALTHGQPASPTTVGKELKVFSYRLQEQFKILKDNPYSAKFGGATGNLNAHNVAYPQVDWVDFANSFVNDTLKLQRAELTTQIENYDHLAGLFDAYKRVCVIMIDLCRDIWQYVSMKYFTQKIKKGEVGSSAMPHKVNPIDFENAEGNLGIAISVLEHLAHKLPISRLQRDLTDSTVLRTIGIPLGHIMISLSSISKGLNKLQINEEAIKADLDDNWAVVAEAIQTILRREGYPKPYEALKELTRTNEAITKVTIQKFIDTLNVSDDIKNELKAISPFNYIGKAI